MTGFGDVKTHSAEKDVSQQVQSDYDVKIKSGTNEETKDEDANDKDLKGETAEYVEGEVLVMYYESAITSKSFKKKLDKRYSIVDECSFKKNNTKNISSKSVGVKKSDVLKVCTVKSIKDSTEELIEYFSGMDNIVAVEPNYIVHTDSFDDSYSKFQWALDNTGQFSGTTGCDVNAEYPVVEHKDNTGEKVVAVVDTGVDYTHEDLVNVMWHNPYQSEGLSGEYGYDYYNDDDDPMDDNGHGTHCAGIIGADSKNGIGIEGVSQNNQVKIMALKALGSNGTGTESTIINCYEYVSDAIDKGINVVCVNSSLGASIGGYYEIIYNEIIELVGNKGTLFVCAAGNDRNDTDVNDNFPSSVDSDYAVSVAASAENDELAQFSNFGEKTVDIAAPGVDILSTVNYNSYSPVLYDDETSEKISNKYYSFDEEKDLVRVIDEDGYTGNVESDNDIAVGIVSNSQGKINLDYSDEQFFGEGANNKSLCLSIEGGKSNEECCLYFPYSASVSDKAMYVSGFAKVLMESPYVKMDNIPELSGNKLEITDGLLDENGFFIESEEAETAKMSMYAYDKIPVNNEINWRKFQVKVADKIETEQKRCLRIKMLGLGNYKIYLDAIGVTKENADRKLFSKYDFMSGTSMAAPHVAGAIASLACMNPEMSALELKKLLLGCTRRNDKLKDKVLTGGVLDLSKCSNPNGFIESATNNNNQLLIEGKYLGDAKCVKIEGEPAQIIAKEDSYITAEIDNKFFNKMIELSVEFEDDVIKKNVYIRVGNHYSHNGEYEADDLVSGFDDEGVTVSTGNKLYVLSDGSFLVGSIPDDASDRIIWEKKTASVEKLFSESVPVGKGYYFGITSATYYKGNIICTLNLYVEGIVERTNVIVGYNIKDEKWYLISSTKGNHVYYDSDLQVVTYDNNVYVFDNYNTDVYYLYDYSQIEGHYDDECYDISWNELSGVLERNCKLSRAYDMDQYEKELWKLNQKYKDIYSECIYKVHNVNNTIVTCMYSLDKYYQVNSLVAMIQADAHTCSIDEVNLKLYGDLKPVTAVVKDGIIFAGSCSEGYGDTFIYNTQTHEFTNTGYTTEFDNHNTFYDSKAMTGGTVKDRFYFCTSEVDFDDLLVKINEYNIPVENAYKYIDLDKIRRDNDLGPSVEVIGESGYYIPDEIVTIKIKATDESNVKRVKINGETVKFDTDSRMYIFEIPAKEFSDTMLIEVDTQAVPNGIYIEGFQISGRCDGMRIVYSVDESINGKKVVSSGLVYSLKDYAKEEDLFVGSNHKYVRSYESTLSGKLPWSGYFDSRGTMSKSYAMTMIFGIDCDPRAYLDNWRTCAYAELDDGSIVYSEPVEYSLFEVATVLYNSGTLEEYYMSSFVDYILRSVSNFIECTYY
jgi:subtilisin family serine protease